MTDRVRDLFVAGLLLLGAPVFDGTASGDPSGTADPICHSGNGLATN